MKNQRISGSQREVDENCALLRFYAASSGKFLQMFGDDERSRIQGTRIRILDPLKMISIGLPKRW